MLIFFKNNPLQELLAASFDLKQDMRNKWIHALSPLVKKAPAQFAIQRDPNKVDAHLAAEQTYLIDTTERPVQRDTYVQEDFYSGKKKPIP